MPESGTRTSYHHGALREELISACIALIESEGIGAVSLRRVAREAGVSPGAPYHHFADRAALLTAIAVRGAQQLERDLRQARADAPTPVRALAQLIEAYVRFAREHTAYLRLMYRPELATPEKDPEAAAATNAALQILTEVVRDCQRAGTAPTGDPEPLVLMVWAIATGIATLWLDGPLEGHCQSIDIAPEVLTRQVTTLLENLLTMSRG